MEHSLPSKVIGSEAYFNSTDPEIIDERESLRATILQYQKEKDARYNALKKQTVDENAQEYLKSLHAKVEEQKRIILKRME